MDQNERIRQIAWDILERWKAARQPNLGPLREADVRARIRYIVENWERLSGKPYERAIESWREIGDEAVAQSFGREAAVAIGWDVNLAVKIAAKLLEEVNCHTERAALIEAARRMGLDVS